MYGYKLKALAQFIGMIYNYKLTKNLEIMDNYQILMAAYANATSAPTFSLLTYSIHSSRTDWK